MIRSWRNSVARKVWDGEQPNGLRGLDFEAAIDLLLEFASRGRQLVFVTCHQHLVQMFRERGVEPTWLPGLAGDTRPDRLAGRTGLPVEPGRRFPEFGLGGDAA